MKTSPPARHTSSTAGLAACVCGLLLAACSATTTSTPDETGSSRVDATRSSVELSRARALSNGSDRILVTVTVRDRAGAPLAGELVRLAASGSGNLVGDPAEPSDLAGQATASLAAVVPGRRELSVFAGTPGVRLSQALAVEFVEGVDLASGLRFQERPRNTRVGEPIMPAVTVAVVDVDGAVVPQPARDILLTIAGGPGHLLGTTTATTVDGVASFPGLRVDAAGNTYSLLANSTRLATSQSPFFQVTAPGSRHLHFVTPPQDGLANVALPDVVVEVLEDGTRSLAPNTRVSLGLLSHPTGATLMGTVEVTAVAGVATFPGLSIPVVGSGYFMQASAESFEPTIAGPISTRAAQDVSLRFAVQASNVTSDGAMQPAVEVELVDHAGMPVLDAAAVVTLDLLGNVDSAHLAGGEAVAVVAGRAVFPNLRVDRVGQGFHLRASAPGLSQVTSSPFNVTPGALAALMVAATPRTLVAGQRVDLVVTAQDAAGNVVEDFHGGLLVTSQDARAVVLDDGALATFAAGVASLSQSVELHTAGTQQVTVAVRSMPTVSGSAEVTVTAGAASRLAFTRMPVMPQVRTPLSPLQVSVADMFGNAVGQGVASLTVSMGPNDVGAHLLGHTTQDTVAGNAVFDDLSVDEEGDLVLLAKAPGFPDALSPLLRVQDHTPPAPPGDFQVTHAFQDSLEFSFVAPGDDGLLGTAFVYELRISTSPIPETDFAAAQFVAMSTAPASGFVQTGNVAALSAATTYHLAIQAMDAAGNTSFATTSGTTLPCPTGSAGATCSLCAEGFHRSGNTCVDACSSPNPCNMPPANMCSGTLLKEVANPGTCATTQAAPYFACTYPSTTRDCSLMGQLCLMGACAASPCVEGSCSASVAVCLEDGVSLQTTSNQCIPASTSSFMCQPSVATSVCPGPGAACVDGGCAHAVPPVAGELVISEVMLRPVGGAGQQWLEVVNVGARVVDLAGLTIKAGGQSFVLPSTRVIALPPQGVSVVGSGTVASANGGAHVDVAVPGLSLPLTGTIEIASQDAVVDSVNITAAFPATPGKALQLAASATTADANNLPWWWCDASASYGSGGMGTPGAANGSCGVVLPASVQVCKLISPNLPVRLGLGVPVTVTGVLDAGQLTSSNLAGNDQHPALQVEVGIGTDAVTPASWTWTPATWDPAYAPSSSTRDSFVGNASWSGSGDAQVGVRVRIQGSTANTAWTYCGTSGVVASGAAGPWAQGTWVTPTIQQVSHVYLPLGSRFTVNGTGLDVVTGMTLGGVAIPFHVDSANVLSVGPVPAQTGLGLQPLVPFTPGAAGTSVDVTVVDLAIQPAAVAHGGTATLRASNLSGATAVLVAGLTVPIQTAGGVEQWAVPENLAVAHQEFSVAYPGGNTAPLPVDVLHLVLSEVDSDDVGSDDLEFVEVSTGVPNVMLSGYALVFFNGGVTPPRSYRTVALDAAADANGLLLVSNPLVGGVLSFPVNTLQNGPDAVALYQGGAAQFPVDSAVSTSGLLDAVVYGSPLQPDLLQGLLGSGANAVQLQESDVVSMQRCALSRLDGRAFTTHAPTPGATNTCP